MSVHFGFLSIAKRPKTLFLLDLTYGVLGQLFNPEPRVLVVAAADH